MVSRERATGDKVFDVFFIGERFGVEVRLDGWVYIARMGEICRIDPISHTLAARPPVNLGIHQQARGGRYK